MKTIKEPVERTTILSQFEWRIRPEPFIDEKFVISAVRVSSHLNIFVEEVVDELSEWAVEFRVRFMVGRQCGVMKA